MGQVLPDCATTTHAVRAALQRSKAPLKDLAAQHGLNPKTVAKWRKRAFVHDAAMGPKEPRSTVLTAEEEAVVVAFRRYTLLPLDDCLYALQATLPHLTRSSLHRCLQRHGISQLPEVGGDKPGKQAFKAYPTGFFHIDIAEVRTGEGKLSLWVAIDRTSKYAFAKLHERADRPMAWRSWRRSSRPALTTCTPSSPTTAPVRRAAQEPPRPHCPVPRQPLRPDLPGARHRASAHQAKPPVGQWPSRAHEPDPQRGDGQTLPLRQPRPAAGTPRRLPGRLQLRPAAQDPTRPHAIRSDTPYEATCRAWADNPDRFRYDPTHLTSGLNT